MNKKFLSAILFGALAVTSTGSFVSCKDYDDDIDNLQTQINGLASAKDLSDKVSALQSAISSAQTAAEAKAAAAQVVADAAKTAAEKAGADAKAANDAAAAAADAAAKALDAAVAVLEKDINDVKGAQAAAEEACKKALDELQAAVDKAATKDELKAAEAAVAAVAEGLEKNIKEVKASVEELASTKADKKDLAAAKEEALAAAAEAKAAAVKVGEDAAAALKASEAKLNEAVAAADAAAKKAQETADKANAAVAELAKTAATKEELAAVAAAAQKAQDAADAAKEDAAAAAAQKAQEAADKNAAAIAAQAKAIEAAATKEAVAGLDTRVKALEAAMEKLAGEDGVAALAKLAEELGGDVEDIQAQLGVISKRLTSLVFAPTTYIDGIETIEFINLKYNDWGTDPNNWLRDGANFHAQSADGLEAAVKVDANNKLVFIDAKNDKEAAKNGGIILGYEYDQYGNLVLDTEGNPIPHCLKVGDKFVAAPDSRNLGDNSTTAEYLVSPSLGVTLNGIAELSYIGNQATNETRAIGAAPIKVVGKDLKDGVLTLNLAKVSASDANLGTGSEEWGWWDPIRYGGPEFNIVSLKATLAEDVLTPEEKEANSEVNVYSDWTRLTEFTWTPYIANKQLKTNGKLDCSYEDDTDADEMSSHFWDFTTIYHNQNEKTGDRIGEIYKTDGPKNNKYGKYSANDAYYIAKEQVYDQELNLLSLVTVCAGYGKDNDNEIKNYEEYGLKFEFHLMDHFIVENENYTQDETDQQLFATLAEDGVTLISRSENGKPKNADAIGRTPVIQAVLKDIVNNKVVDVRYFKIKWTETAPNIIEAPLAPIAAVPYSCDEDEPYESYILEAYMNNLYADLNQPTGYSKKQFHAFYSGLYPNTYSWMGAFYAYTYTKNPGQDNEEVITYSMDEIKKMLEANADLEDLMIGYAVDMYDEGYTSQTRNVLISVDPTDYRIAQAEEKDFAIEGFYVYQTQDKSNKLIVPVTFDVMKGAIVPLYGYLAPQWEGQRTLENINKTRPVNPTLISDKNLGADVVKTTQLVGDITYGYMSDSKTPVDFMSLIGYKPWSVDGKAEVEDAESDVVFDKDRLAILPEIPFAVTVDNGKATEAWEWRVVENGKVLEAVKYAVADEDKDAVEEIIAARIGESICGQGANKYVYLVDQPVGVTEFSNGEAYDPEATDDATDTSNPSEAALLLVGNQVPVIVKATTVCHTTDFDKYLVRFITPLTFNASDKGVDLQDVLNYGDAKGVAIDGQLTVKEAFGSETPLILFGEKATNELNDWYGVKGLKIDVEKALINLDSKGEYVTDQSKYTFLANNVFGDEEPLWDKDGNKNDDWEEDDQLYVLKLQKIKAGTGTETVPVEYEDWDPASDEVSAVAGLKFHNNSGQALGKGEKLEILVPVSLDTKWQRGINKYIKVVVKSGVK